MKILFFFVLITLLPRTGYSQIKAKMNPYNIGDFSVSTENFLNFLRKESPTAFCTADSYFTKCFYSGDTPCIKETQRQFDQCRNTLRLPASFDSTEVDLYSQKMGSCMGASLEKKWTAQKKRTRECRQRL